MGGCKKAKWAERTRAVKSCHNIDAHTQIGTLWWGNKGRHWENEPQHQAYGPIVKPLSTHLTTECSSKSSNTCSYRGYSSSGDGGGKQRPNYGNYVLTTQHKRKEAAVTMETKEHFPCAAAAAVML